MEHASPLADPFVVGLPDPRDKVPRMHARVITFEVEGRLALNDAQDALERLVVPEMRRLPGYDGAYILRDSHTHG